MLATALAAEASRDGKRTEMFDLDPQASPSFYITRSETFAITDIPPASPSCSPPCGRPGPPAERAHPAHCSSVSFESFLTLVHGCPHSGSMPLTVGSSWSH
jgi:hypothetical protein